MIHIHNLYKKYPNSPTPVLKDVHLDFEDTGLVYLIGKSGAGKSTLMNLIGLIDEEYQGSIRYNNTELSEMREEEKSRFRFECISFVFQSYHAEDQESVKDNLLKALAITSLPQKEKIKRIQNALALVDLSNKENALFKNLSGGEKKRISLIRGLIRETPILLLDEPLSNLNSQMRKRITSILERESKKRLVIVITHEKEEIPSCAYIYEIVNGNVYQIRKGVQEDKKASPSGYKRIPFGKIPFLHQLFSTLKSKREFLIITLFSLMVGLFSISFSFQLSTSVSASMESSMSSYMEENCMVISKKDTSLTGVDFQNPDYSTLQRIKSRHPDRILCLSTFYTSSLDNIFYDNQSVQIQFNKRTLNMDSLSMDSFLEYRITDELINQTIYGQKSELEDDDILLALKENEVIALYVMLFDTKIESIDESVLQKIGNQIQRNIIQLRIQANKDSWGYFQDYSFRVKGIVLDDKTYLLHSSPTFSNHFVSDVMHFEEIGENEKADENKPWTVKKLEGYRLVPGTSGDFLKEILEDEIANEMTLKIVKTENYFEESDRNTHNHVAVVRDYLPKINLSEIMRFIKDQKDNIQGVSYSSPVYTYTASGYISGFAKPFFFSKYKEKLNQIEDDSTFSDQDLGSFQGSLVDSIPGVIKADLLSSMNRETNLSFITLNNQEIKPFYGKKPTNFNEIGISKKMAVELFHSATNALNKSLCTLTLDSTSKSNGRYKNHFTQGEVTITGIYENDNLAIYQDSLFPLCYSFSYGQLKSEETRIQQVIIKMNLEKHSTEEYLAMIRNYGDYQGSFPMYLMIREIKNTLSMLSNLFFGFSILSILSSASLLGLSLYLIINRDRKEIGILLSLGYTRKEISRFYVSLSVCVGIIGFVFSMILSLVTERILNSTLTDILSDYVSSIKPYLISFLIAISMTLAIGSFFSLKIKEISIREAFVSNKK
jgi:ABC-type lipoprotein export system ATPase subunit/ABC-type antimicrobial peptide transport system permease subunit